MKYTRFDDIKPFTSSGSYQVNISWLYLEKTLSDWANDYTLHLDPDFQRAHVWDETKQIRYVEYILRNGRSSRVIYWNAPGWGGHGKVRSPKDIYLVDGKQRVEAVRRFLRSEIPAFGTLYKNYLDTIRLVMADFVFVVNDLDTRAEMLQWYLDLNEGGVVHTEDELSRVRELLRREGEKNESAKVVEKGQ